MNIRSKIAGLFLFLMLVVFSMHAQNRSKIEQRIDSLLNQMTTEEKVMMCNGAVPEMAFRGVPRLSIPNVPCCDGPRGPNPDVPATAFPCGVLVGATWNPGLIEAMGKVMGEETNAKGRKVLLGPSVNILRDPLCGRFFEYYTEDPYLNSKITVAAVRGIQSEGVAACLKHYACNNREDNRGSYMSMVDERTLREIYLPVFEAAVKEAGVDCIMTAANGVNGDFVSDSHTLLSDILKNEWGFDGFVLTDWLQTRSTEKAAFAGLDVSMPGGTGCGFGEPLLEAVNKGKVPIKIIDDKVRRILRVYARLGVLDGNKIITGGKINTPEHQKLALQVAQEGIVLLRNQNKTLPLKPHMKILVTGPNADKRFCLPGMGGSSGIESPYEITVLGGLKNSSNRYDVTYFPTDKLGGFQRIPENSVHTDREGKQSGWSATYYGKDNSTVQRIEKGIDFMWEMKSPDKRIDPKTFSANYQGWITPPVSGTYTLRLTVGGWCAIFPEGCYGAPTIVADDSKEGQRTVTATIQLQKDVPYFFCVNYSKNRNSDASVLLEWKLPDTRENLNEYENLYRMAEASDAVIFVGGIDHSLDTEGRDRFNMDFPGDQEYLIENLSKVNKKLVVVLINGSPMKISGWLKDVPAVVESWYGGMEGGRAVSSVLSGESNPSGRLSFTWPKELEDSPCYKLGNQNNDSIFYKEKLMLGYRYYDTYGISPQFPFGYGLSYTTFRYGKLGLSKRDNEVYATVKVKNVGKYDGYETVQLYVGAENSSVERPVHELKSFKKVFLKRGEEKKVEFILPERSFAYYSIKEKRWVVEDGTYRIEAAASSQDIRSRSEIKISGDDFRD